MSKSKHGLSQPSLNTLAINFIILCVIVGWVVNMVLGAGVFLIYFAYFFVGLIMASAKPEFYTNLFTTKTHEYILGYKILIWPKYLPRK